MKGLFNESRHAVLLPCRPSLGVKSVKLDGSDRR
jgi:hypothetical protein